MIATHVGRCPCFPSLDLASLPHWKKFVEVIQFLPVAFQAIEKKQLKPTITFHLLDRQDNFAGISGGDVCYGATFKDVETICHLTTEFEDKRFFKHCGVDLFGILRAMLRNFLACRIIQGGSTITQQLVRNTLLTPDRSFARKLAEIILSLKIERHYSKKEILFLYGQSVYLGNGIRGFPAASKAIYRKPIQLLNRVQACGLIGLLRQPSVTYPSKNITRYLDRQALLASFTTRTKLINKEHRDALRLSLRPPNPIPIHDFRKHRWTHIAETLTRDITPDDQSLYVTRLGLTIDQPLQRIVDDALKDVSLDRAVTQVAGVILSNRTADILVESAWSNGRDLAFSPTFHGKLQPGSTFKTFAYIAALEAGLSNDLLLESRPFESSFIKNRNGDYWRVRNYADNYQNRLTLDEALQRSDNTAFARLAEIISIDQLQSTYHRFGLCNKASITPAIVLGGSTRGVSLLSLISAYAAIARNGSFIQPRFIRYLQYSDGSVGYLPPSRKETLVIQDSAILGLLKATLRQAGQVISAVPFSGKTGTTKKGSIFVGYNDEVSVAVWLGYRNVQNEYDNKAISAVRTVERIIQKLLGYRRDLFTI